MIILVNNSVNVNTVMQYFGGTLIKINRCTLRRHRVVLLLLIAGSSTLNYCIINRDNYL